MTLIDEVKSRTDIVDVIASVVDLDTSSRNPKARCPFHNERTPSFHVFPETGTWRCFGACATGGDVFAFVMKQEGIEFREALHRLADRAGVKHTSGDASVQQDAAPKRTVIEANRVAAKWFSQMLLGSEGADAREYLASRGIDTDMAVRRGMGFAPGGGTLTLAGHLKSSSVEPQAARDARLVVLGQDKTWRDFFRNRLTIEIRNRNGEVIGFGARSLDGSEPKYLNTPQTSAFDKSRVLYGLDWAGDTLRQSRRAVVVEGYMDVITAHEHGFTDAVASMGTAVTSEQLNSLAQIVSGGDQAGEVILCLDSDAAGQDATLRALEIAWQEFGSGSSRSSRRSSSKSLSVRVAAPFDGKDPDEAIRSDSWAWRRSLDEAAPLMDFIMQAYIDRTDVDTGEGKAAVVQAMAPLIFSLANDYDRDRYWERLGTRLDVSAERLRSMASASIPRSAAGRGNAVRRSSEKPVSTEQLGAVLGSASGGIEEHLLALCFEWPDLREYAEAVPSEHFLDTANRELFTWWQSNSTLDSDERDLSPDLDERYLALRSINLPPSDAIQRVTDVTQCVRRMRERFYRHLLEDHGSILEATEGELDDEGRERLRGKTLDLSENLKKVFHAGATGRV